METQVPYRSPAPHLPVVALCCSSSRGKANRYIRCPHTARGKAVCCKCKWQVLQHEFRASIAINNHISYPGASIDSTKAWSETSILRAGFVQGSSTTYIWDMEER